MVNFIVTLILGALALAAMSLLRAYGALPAKEIRRRARAGDNFASIVHKAVRYGHSLRAVLWLFVGVTWSVFFVYVANVWPDFIAFGFSMVLLIGGLVYMPSTQVNSISARIAVAVSPAVAWALNYLHTPIDAIANFVRKHRPVRVHTGLYEREDLLELLDRQQVQSDNRIEAEELRIAQHALTFGQKIVRDVMTPRRMVHMVQADDVVGPILMADLHKTGHSRFPVYGAEKDEIVGTLYLRELMNVKEGGLVKSVMRAKDVCYVHEERPLTDALQAVFKTRRHLMIVVNSFEEFVGIITIEDVLEQIVGRPIMDEFDQYEDIRAVAARIAAKERAKRKGATVQPDGQSETEVVE